MHARTHAHARTTRAGIRAWLKALFPCSEMVMVQISSSPFPSRPLRFPPLHTQRIPRTTFTWCTQHGRALALSAPGLHGTGDSFQRGLDTVKTEVPPTSNDWQKKFRQLASYKGSNVGVVAASTTSAASAKDSCRQSVQGNKKLINGDLHQPMRTPGPTTGQRSGSTCSAR